MAIRFRQTANTLAVLKDQGVVLNEPAVVAVIEDG